MQWFIIVNIQLLLTLYDNTNTYGERSQRYAEHSFTIYLYPFLLYYLNNKDKIIKIFFWLAKTIISAFQCMYKESWWPIMKGHF